MFHKGTSFVALARRPLFRPTRSLLLSKSFSSTISTNTQTTTNNITQQTTNASSSSSLTSPASPAQAVMSLLEKIAQRGRQGGGVSSQANVLRQRNQGAQQQHNTSNKSDRHQRKGRPNTSREHKSTKPIGAARRNAFSPASLFEVQPASRVVRGPASNNKEINRRVIPSTTALLEDISHDVRTPEEDTKATESSTSVTHTHVSQDTHKATHNTTAPPKIITTLSSSLLHKLYDSIMNKTLPWQTMLTIHPTLRQLPLYAEKEYWTQHYCSLNAATPLHPTTTTTDTSVDSETRSVVPPVLLCTAPTGAGKSVLVPFYLLEAHWHCLAQRLRATIQLLTSEEESVQDTMCSAEAVLPFARDTQERFVKDFAACSRVCVVVSQPTRLACMELARYAASLLTTSTNNNNNKEEEEQDCLSSSSLLGQRVGYAVSGEAVFTADTELIFATPGYILSALQASAHNTKENDNINKGDSNSDERRTDRSAIRQLRPTTLVVDEAHCRNLETDLLLAWVKQYRVHAQEYSSEGNQVRKGECISSGVSRLRQVVVMSATMHTVGMMRYLQLPSTTHSDDNEDRQDVYYMADREERRRLASSAMSRVGSEEHNKALLSSSTTQDSAMNDVSCYTPRDALYISPSALFDTDPTVPHELAGPTQDFMLRSTQLQSGPFRIERYFLEDVQSGLFTQSSLLFQPWCHIPRDMTVPTARARQAAAINLSDELTTTTTINVSSVGSSSGMRGQTMTSMDDNMRLPLLLGADGAHVMETLGCFYNHNSLRSILLYSQAPAFAIFLLYLLQVVDMRWGAQQSTSRVQANNGSNAMDSEAHTKHSVRAVNGNYGVDNESAPLGVLVFLPGFAEIQLVLQMLEQVCARQATLTGVLSGKAQQKEVQQLRMPMAAQHAGDESTSTSSAQSIHHTSNTMPSSADTITTLSYSEMHFSVPILHSQAIGAPDDQLARSLECGAPLRLILATSVAESSLTIPNVRLVVDCGLGRSFVADTLTETTQRRTSFVDVHTLRQRCGRAGRTCDGVVLHLVPRYFYATLASSTTNTNTSNTTTTTTTTTSSSVDEPAMPWVEPLTDSTSTILLRVKHLFSQGSQAHKVTSHHFSLCVRTSDMLASLPCPPQTEELQAAYTHLVDAELIRPAATITSGPTEDTKESNMTRNGYPAALCARVDASKLTAKGRIVAALPLPPELGLFVFHSAQFACLEDALLVACAMTVPSVFLAPRLATHTTTTITSTSSSTSTFNSTTLPSEIPALTPLEQYYRHLYIQRELAGFPLDNTNTNDTNNTTTNSTATLHAQSQEMSGRLSEPLVLHRILSRWYTASTRDELFKLQSELNLNRSAMRTIDLAILQCCNRLVPMLQGDEITMTLTDTSTFNSVEEWNDDIHEGHNALLDPTWPTAYRTQLIKSLRRLRLAALERATQRVLTSFRTGLSQWYSADDQLVRLLSAHYTHQSLLALTQAEQHGMTRTTLSSAKPHYYYNYNEQYNSNEYPTRSQVEVSAEGGVWHHPSFAQALRRLERKQRNALFQNELYRSVRHSESHTEGSFTQAISATQVDVMNKRHKKKKKNGVNVAVVSPHVRAILHTRAVQGLTRRPYRFVYGTLVDRLCAAYVAAFARHTMRGEDSNGYRQHQRRLVRNVGVLHEDTSQVCTFNVDIRVAIESTNDSYRNNGAESSESNSNQHRNAAAYASHVSRYRSMRPIGQLLNLCSSQYAWLQHAVSPERIRAVLEPYMRGTGLVQLELFRTGRTAAARFARPPFATLFSKAETMQDTDTSTKDSKSSDTTTTTSNRDVVDLLAPKVIPPPAEVYIGRTTCDQPQPSTSTTTKALVKVNSEGSIVQLAPFGVSLLAAAQAALHHIPFTLTRPSNSSEGTAETNITPTLPATTTTTITNYSSNASQGQVVRDVHMAMMNETKDEVQWCSTYGVMYRLRCDEVAALGFAHLFPQCDNNNTSTMSVQGQTVLRREAVKVNGHTSNAIQATNPHNITTLTKQDTTAQAMLPASVEATLSISPPINISRGIQWRVNLPCSALRRTDTQRRTRISTTGNSDVSCVYSCELCNLMCSDATHFAAHCQGLRHLEHLHYAVRHGIVRSEWLEVCGGGSVASMAKLLYRNTESNSSTISTGMSNANSSAIDTVAETMPAVRSALYACRTSHLSFLNILRYSNNNSSNEGNAAPIAIAGSLLSSSASASLWAEQDTVQLPANTVSTAASQQSNNKYTGLMSSKAQVLSAHHVWVLDFDPTVARAVCNAYASEATSSNSDKSKSMESSTTPSGTPKKELNSVNENILTLQVQPALVPAGLFVLAGYLAASTWQFATSLLVNASHTYVHAIMLYDWGVWKLPRPLRLSQLDVLHEVQRGGGWPGYVEWLDEPDINSFTDYIHEDEEGSRGTNSNNSTTSANTTPTQQRPPRHRPDYAAMRAEMYSDLHWCLPTKECPECTFTGAMHTTPTTTTTHSTKYISYDNLSTGCINGVNTKDEMSTTEIYVERERRYLTGAAMQPAIVRASIAKANRHTVPLHTNTSNNNLMSQNMTNYNGNVKNGYGLNTSVCGAQEVIAADATVAATLLLVLQEYMQAQRTAVSLTDYVERVLAKLELLQSQATHKTALHSEAKVENNGFGVKEVHVYASEGSNAMQLLRRFLARRAPQKLEGLLRDLGCQFSAPPIALAQAMEEHTQRNVASNTEANSTSQDNAAQVNTPSFNVSLPPSALTTERAVTTMTFTLPPILPSLLPAPQFAAQLKAHLRRVRERRRDVGAQREADDERSGREDGEDAEDEDVTGGTNAALRF